jgi:hypothetical protein
MAWYPPNNFPVSTISGDVGGAGVVACAARRRREYDGGSISNTGNMDGGTGGCMTKDAGVATGKWTF